MKQIVVLSGKGGTGKTVMSGALSAHVENKVIVDCDVDAADLHLLLKPQCIEKHDFYSGQKASINTDVCTQCGLCREVCRFDAITQDFIVDDISCEGCGFCFHVCPVSAVVLNDNLCGEWYVSTTRFGPMVHAALGVGEENSGKLVAKIREKAKELAEQKSCDWVIIDGPPGIGCPVMAALSGVDGVLLVTEPTCSGLHDAGRVIDLAKHFKVPVFLVVNKWDINPEVTVEIENFCTQKGVLPIGRIPFHEDIVKTVVHGHTIMESANVEIKQGIIDIWDQMKVRV